MNKPKYFKAWIVFFVVGTVGGLVAGGIVGGGAGLALAILNGGNGNAVAENEMLFKGLGFLVGIPISYLVYRWSVSSFVLPQLKEKDSVVAVEERKRAFPHVLINQVRDISV